MTGTKLYHFSFKVEVRNASGTGFICNYIQEPDGDPTVFFGKLTVKEHYDEGTITNETEYDLTITHDGDVCEEPETTNDAEPGKDYGDYHSGEDEVEYGGPTVTASQINEYAQGRASAALAGADWSNFVGVVGSTWGAANAMKTSTTVGEGPNFGLVGGLSTAGAMELRMYLRPPYIPVTLVFGYQGGEFSFDLSATPTIWTPAWPVTGGAPNPITMRAYPRPYDP